VNTAHVGAASGSSAGAGASGAAEQGGAAEAEEEEEAAAAFDDSSVHRYVCSQVAADRSWWALSCDTMLPLHAEFTYM
jgi:hypothetical protein